MKTITTKLFSVAALFCLLSAVCIPAASVFGQDTLKLSESKRDKVYYNQGVLNIGYIYQPSRSLIFYGTSNSPQLTITFGDTIYIKTTVPTDSAGKLIIDWTNKWYDWYVQSLRDTIADLRQRAAKKSTNGR